MNHNIKEKYKFAMEKPLDTNCSHTEYENIIVNDGDGIDEVFIYDTVCKTCKKILVKQYRCISANWNKIYDEEWAKLHRISSIDY